MKSMVDAQDKSLTTIIIECKTPTTYINSRTKQPFPPANVIVTNKWEGSHLQKRVQCPYYYDNWIGTS